MPINESVIAGDVVRPTHVEVNRTRLAENFQAIRSHAPDCKIMPVLKANAYGHGLVEVARLMQTLKADYIGVAVLEEGMLLRQAGIEMPILVLGGVLGNQIPHFLEYNLTITASSRETLTHINEAAGKAGVRARVHLKIDTGMERIGVHYYNAAPFLESAAQCPYIFVEGIFSHFANSEKADLTHARLQLERFNRVLTFYQDHGLKPPPTIHMANSGAILQLPEARFNMIRPGILMYGVYPSHEVKRSVPVKPALTWKSRVVYFKVIQPGHPVGYGSTWQTDHPIHAVTIPVGYGDGYFRSLSHKARVVLNGRSYPVIGTVSMDQIVVNIEQDSAYNNDPVILIGEMNQARISCEDMAGWAGTIAYEILTNINTRVPRIYVD
ncbi:alanine racemase [bacterium]|nr:alanine racemase [bacterium]